MKIGTNSYYRITNWKNSPDLEGYEERPANGWDVRAQDWLPSYPQFGARMTYEQFYGDNVALFGKDKRQKNPQSITAGFNYPPVPLLTVSAKHRHGKSG
ncbi:TPA: inverse autotransporter beta domain-containing protein [Enterobacter roggenkampii]|nr:inverse autotransporter beta domain-containing protein [Enterobacter roggenkampii]